MFYRKIENKLYEYYKNQNAKVQQKPVAKKGLFARIKAFFSK